MQRGIFMTITEIQKQLDVIKGDRLVGAHHDDIFFTTQADMEALERIIALIAFLSEKKPSDKLKVAEILAAANIDA
ncbi:MAG: hypothetical protein SR3Q1_00465 [Quinella sp. 3Q1]|nr:hypothetical protein [Quinella sp. 3Q1]